MRINKLACFSLCVFEGVFASVIVPIKPILEEDFRLRIERDWAQIDWGLQRKLAKNDFDSFLIDLPNDGMLEATTKQIAIYMPQYTLEHDIELNKQTIQKGVFNPLETIRSLDPILFIRHSSEHIALAKQMIDLQPIKIVVTQGNLVQTQSYFKQPVFFSPSVIAALGITHIPSIAFLKQGDFHITLLSDKAEMLFSEFKEAIDHEGD